MAVPENIFLYRMVHWQNVEYILQNGLCCREHANADPNYINIGHRQLISDRHNHPIALPNAGNLGDYVPFYFAGHSPMLYLIKNGYQGVAKRPQEDIVYLVCNFETIENSGLEYVFTDRNAKISITNFYTDKQDFEKLHWEIINSKHLLTLCSSIIHLFNLLNYYYEKSITNHKLCGSNPIFNQ